MTSYELWLFLHISAAAVWIGGAVAAQVFGALAQRSGDPARSAAFGQDLGRVVSWVFIPSALLVLVSGILLTEDGNWDWDEWFVVLGLIGWAIVAVTGFGYVRRAMRQVGARMAAEGPSPKLASEARRILLLARFLILVLFVVVLVMVVKPGA